MWEHWEARKYAFLWIWFHLFPYKEESQYKVLGLIIILQWNIFILMVVISSRTDWRMEDENDVNQPDLKPPETNDRYLEWNHHYYQNIITSTKT